MEDLLIFKFLIYVQYTIFKIKFQGFSKSYGSEAANPLAKKGKICRFLWKKTSKMVKIYKKIYNRNEK